MPEDSRRREEDKGRSEEDKERREEERVGEREGKVGMLKVPLITWEVLTLRSQLNTCDLPWSRVVNEPIRLPVLVR